MTTLVLVFEKIKNDNIIKYDTFYSNSKAEIFFNENDIDNVLESVYTTTISNIQKPLGKGSGRITDSWKISIFVNKTELCTQIKNKLVKITECDRKFAFTKKVVDKNSNSAKYQEKIVFWMWKMSIGTDRINNTSI